MNLIKLDSTLDGRQAAFRRLGHGDLQLGVQQPQWLAVYIFWLGCGLLHVGAWAQAGE